MDTQGFLAVMDVIGDLTPTQCTSVISAATKQLGKTATTEAINARGHEDLAKCCPHCKSDNVGGWGSARGLRRWRCRVCKKTFTGLTSAPLAKLRKRSKWLRFVTMMLTSVPASLREIAKALEIHVSTAWRWRHAFLGGLPKDCDPELSGICEFDETFTVESRKGSREWVKWEKGLPGAVEPDRDPRRKKGQASKLASSLVRG